jgi:cobalt-zinc-cadmium efflux system membrane fusion protein
VSARVSTGAGSGALVVPIDAVQTVEGTLSVFVLEKDGFRARPVATGRTSDGRIEVVSGLFGSERIAGAGAFLLKAELAKGEAEHGH